MDLVSVVAPLHLYDVPDPEPGKRRILVFNWRDMKHVYAGGAEVYVNELAKRWVKDGNQVTLFCGSDGTGTAPRHEILDGINIIRRGGNYGVYVWAFLYYMLRLRGKFDIIIDCENGIPFFTPFYAREPIISVVHHIHQDVFKQHLPPLQAKFACWLEAYLMPRAYRYSQYVAVSPSTKKEMEDMGMTSNRSIAIVYNGVNLDTLQPGIKNETPLLLFLGRLQHYKSVDTLLHAFTHVHKEHPQTKLVVAGGGDAKDHLEKLARKLKIEDHVEFTGKISEEKKLSLLQRAWLMANPSMKEGWGITTIEANACATPVIGADVPGLRDSIVHDRTGKLVPHGDHERFAKTINTLLNDVDERRKLEDESHHWAQQFDWDNSAAEMYDVIDAELASEQTGVYA